MTTEPKPLWRYCPRCWTVGQTSTRNCTHCRLAPRLLVVPVSPEALEAAVRTGGIEAAEALVAFQVAGDDGVATLYEERRQLEERQSWWENFDLADPLGKAPR